jgi:protoporphyrinogen oxidase
MSHAHDRDKKVVVIGAGPAGLTAAYELCKVGIPSVVLEKDDIVGGISRTVTYNGYHFDIGGHRFFTKVKQVEDMWHEVMPEGEFLHRSRMSRIYYNKKFFHYPLRAGNALSGLGLWNSILIGLSYVKARLFPKRNEQTFEDWVSNRFGKRLYNTFFKAYTEKVWGIPCSKISAEWAAQRIKGLSLLTALKNALLSKQQPANKQDVIKTLIDSFHYPKRGPGMMWEIVADKVSNDGSEVRMNSDVTKLYWSEGRIDAVGVGSNGTVERLDGTDFVSTMPIRELVQKLDPPPPPDVLQAADSLGYRDFLTVALVVKKADLFPDNWVYIHDPDVKVGRIQNFKNWSPYMVPDETKSCIGLEYFCFEGDGLWTTPDDELIELGKREMDKLGLIPYEDVEDGAVVRMPKAYPVYDDVYTEHLAKIREFLDRLSNLHLVGRNGMHKYNNQDHSMLTAMLAVKNIQGANIDVWAVNADQDYHEEVSAEEAERKPEFKEIAATQPLVPSTVPEPSAADRVILKAFARLDRWSFAGAVGIVTGMCAFLATVILLIKGGAVIGPRLALLGNYFLGYTVSWSGAFVGLFYGAVYGFIAGWMFAYIRNAMMGFYVNLLRRRAEAERLKDFLNYI